MLGGLQTNMSTTTAARLDPTIMEEIGFEVQLTFMQYSAVVSFNWNYGMCRCPLGI